MKWNNEKIGVTIYKNGFLHIHFMLSSLFLFIDVRRHRCCRHCIGQNINVCRHNETKNGPARNSTTINKYEPFLFYVVVADVIIVDLYVVIFCFDAHDKFRAALLYILGWWRDWVEFQFTSNGMIVGRFRRRYLISDVISM